MADVDLPRDIPGSPGAFPPTISLTEETAELPNKRQKVDDLDLDWDWRTLPELSDD